LEDEGIAFIAEGIKDCKKLKELHVYQNTIRDGMHILLNTLN